MPKTILIVDDEVDMLNLLQRSLKSDLDCEPITASSGEKALQVLSKRPVDLVLADIRMPRMDGMELLELIKKNDPEMTVVMMTAYGHIEMAVDAMKRGAYDFITKPFDHDTLIVRLEKALERSSLIRENLRLQKECGSGQAFQDLVGAGSAMKRIYETIRMAAKTDLTVLITGESGTGKELAARAIHALSPRKDAAFVTVNCPAVPEAILESELFGYKKGAFTHATQNKAGMFNEADLGSIFLDEIGDISPAIQTKLLRVLQEKEIRPLGGTKSIQVDVRIIASTNQNLREKINKGEFREDFYYRLNVLQIRLPALREHREDIPLIADHLLKKHCRKLDSGEKIVSPELMRLFMEREWEGNVRELENLIIRGILYSEGREILPSHAGLLPDRTKDPAGEASRFENLPYKAAKERNLESFNNGYIGRLLMENNGNITQAAKACGLERQALQQIMRRYGIRSDDFRE